MRRLSLDLNLAFRKLMIGKESDAIVIKKRGPEAWVLTENYIEVSVPWCPADERDTIKVRINRVKDKKTLGQVP